MLTLAFEALAARRFDVGELLLVAALRREAGTVAGEGKLLAGAVGARPIGVDDLPCNGALWIEAGAPAGGAGIRT